MIGYQPTEAWPRDDSPGSLHTGPQPPESDGHDQTSEMPSPVADLAKDCEQTLSYLDLIPPKAGQGLEEAGSVNKNTGGK